MKRLIKKSESALQLSNDVEIGDTVHLSDDVKYDGLDMDALSRSQNRDGAVLVDTKEDVVRWGLNGETHAELLEKYYNIDKDSNELNHDIDSYVVPGVYLKNFLGYETIILYNDNISGVENIIKNENSNIRVFVDDWDDGIQRLARLIIKRVG